MESSCLQVMSDGAEHEAGNDVTGIGRGPRIGAVQVSM